MKLYLDYNLETADYSTLEYLEKKINAFIGLYKSLESVDIWPFYEKLDEIKLEKSMRELRGEI